MNIDNLLTGFREAIHPQAKFYEGDIRDKSFLDSVFSQEKIDGIIHFAASSQVGESMINPLKYYNNNPETHLIPLILQVPNGKREYISIFGMDYDTKDGTCVRDYIRVNDLAQAHILAMEYLTKG